MLLNEIPTLDKGYVALVASSLSSQKLREIEEHFHGTLVFNEDLKSLGSMTLAIKCPLFVQLYLSKFNLRLTPLMHITDNKVEAYKPNTIEVNAPDITISSAIADDISRTTDALLINPKAYQSDGCDPFISQLITPVNVYTTLMVSGYYNDWKSIVNSTSFKPSPCEAYVAAIKQVLEGEWK